MSEPRPTLVAIDFSPSSLAALDLALLLARKEEGGAIHLLHAVALPTVPLASGDVVLAADLDTRIRAGVDRALRELVTSRRDRGIPIDAAVATGWAPDAILAEAARLHARRIVVGASRPGPLARVLLGSVSDRVARTSPIDVIVVPSGTPPTSRDRIRNVVCATDFSAPAANALLRALEIVRAHDARLHLVHAWEVAPYVERIPELRASIEVDLSRELEACARRHEAPGIPILRHLRRGHPPETIVQLATEVDADLVLVGTTGKRGIDHLLLGSVAERVARTSPAPVWIARGA